MENDGDNEKENGNRTKIILEHNGNKCTTGQKQDVGDRYENRRGKEKGTR